MKFVRFGNLGEEKPGLIDGGNHLRDLSSYLPDFTPLTLGNRALIETLKTLNPSELPLVEKATRIGACVGAPGKILCVGYNSKLHAQEMGRSLIGGEDMVVFMKPSSALCGPNDPILYTRYMKKLDWEAELGLVIGKKGKYISKSDAGDHILGYTCVNDLSERYLQLETEDTQYTKGKGFDNAAPIGPYLVTKDEVPNACDLTIELSVNGILRQHFNTTDYIHNDEEVVSYLSRYFTLYPGDIISMGSAPGSAKFWGENLYLKPDDKVLFSITGLGQQEKIVMMEKE